MSTLSLTLSTKEAQRFGRFLVVGLGGTALDFSVLVILKLLGLPTLFANTLSFSAGVINNYSWNRAWTFADSKADWRKQFVQFLVVSLIGLALNNALVLTLEPVINGLFGGATWGYLPAKAIATGVVVFWNYFANKHWTFRAVEQNR